jgi:hypothetical protein
VSMNTDMQGINPIRNPASRLSYLPVSSRTYSRSILFLIAINMATPINDDPGCRPGLLWCWLPVL